jgi:hypothetical protein
MSQNIGEIQNLALPFAKALNYQGIGFGYHNISISP